MANKNCTTCENGKLDEQWGEYKCLKYGHRIYHPTLKIKCGGYADKRKKEKK